MTVFDFINATVLFISILLLITSFVRLYRWRRSAFDSTSGYMRNLRYYYPGEEVCIPVPDKPGIEYIRSAKSPKTMVYWEYCYTVEGIPYCKSYFYEDDGEKLPYKIKIYYNRKNPKIMYREGAMRDGVFMSALSIFLGSFLMFAVIAYYVF